LFLIFRLSIFTNIFSKPKHTMELKNNTTDPLSHNNTTLKKRRSKKILLVILSVLLILAIPIYIFWDVISLQYYNLRVNHAHMNDKLYPAAWLTKTDHKFHIKLYRTAEPISSDGEKLVVDGGWEINGDSLAKYNIGYAGYYKGYKILNSAYGYKMLYYVISPVQKGLERIYYESELQLPKGYKLTNEPFHVLAFEISTDGPPK
jgi:flagellar basal body-associated protein FliL